MSLAFLFPGQGSQAVGMGTDLAAAFASAREVFEGALLRTAGGYGCIHPWIELGDLSLEGELEQPRDRQEQRGARERKGVREQPEKCRTLEARARCCLFHECLVHS
jgi:hypothetical protein